MRQFIKRKYDWWRHFIWLIGRLFYWFLLLDEDSFIDTWFWIKIHLTHKSKCIK